MRVIIINGPNLNLLGKREKSIYGDISFEAYFERLKGEFYAIELEYYQSNVEGELINKLQEV
ncbi:MAG: type II 3-dehydroquinate dehydratase, partial [Bacteroidota bacterium]|nr:type II 3-dehydroquinate dehydratase [Bacteroidota bacterium]